MAVSHRGAISFGLVHIPVGLYTATQLKCLKFIASGILTFNSINKY